MYKFYSIKTKLIASIVTLMLITNLTIGLLSYYTAKQQLDESGKIILTNGVHMVQEAIKLQKNDVTSNNITLEEAQENIKQLILGPKDDNNQRPINRQIDLGENGYFFILSDTAYEIAHPSIEDTNTWETKDMSGDDVYVAQDIIKNAQAGGGFSYYAWHYPYTDRVAQKVAYAEYDSDWNWVIVASIYMEDFNRGANKIISVLMVSSLLTTLIGLIVISFINHHITKPVIAIAKSMNSFVENDMEYTPVYVQNRDEIKSLSDSYNSMAETVLKEISKRHESENELLKSNQELEIRVEERTERINETNDALKEALHISEARKLEVSNSLNELKRTQAQLIESEKMAAIGNLVAGIAHEINTPLGVSITLSSYIEDIHKKLLDKIEKKEVSQKTFDHYSTEIMTSVEMQLHNLQNAAELVKNFKNISVDYHHTTETTFKIKQQLDFLMIGLKHHNHLGHRIHLDCPESLEIKSYPSIISQVITNLILNSFMHGFKNVTGDITISVKQEEQIVIVYTDNGSGIPEKHKTQIFDPFFTTNRGGGGTGLGLFVVYNLVVHKLGGMINLDPSYNDGVRFVIKIPK